MKVSLLLVGIIILLGIFFYGNVLISPQQRSQIGLASGACGSIFGQIGSALSGNIATECRNVQGANQLLSLEPFAYILGFILLVLGLIIPSGKKEHVIREVVREPVKSETKIGEESEIEPEYERIGKVSRISKSKQSLVKTKYCGKCGSKISTGSKFCSECGEKL